MNRHLVTTKDQSPTLFVPELDEHYHSIHGALQESQHVFIKAGLQKVAYRASLNILEVGFGTGLNAWLSAHEAQNLKLEVHYTGLEKYPLSSEEWQALNYAQLLNTAETEQQAIFEKLHQAPWEKEQAISAFFHLKKMAADLTTVPLPMGHFHLIYFDAFAPSAQEHLWTQEIFQKMFDCLQEDGYLVTYCVKGWVRRNMQAAGFTVEKIPGPPGKREMARAYKPIRG